MAQNGKVNPTTLPKTLSAPQSITETYIPEYVVIRASDEITFTSEISASILKENVKEGSLFAKNDILIQMDCRVQEAELQKALSQQQLSKVAIMSAQKLKTYNAISLFEFAQAEAQAEGAQAEVNKLQAIVEKCTIKAPFDGSVARLMMHTGETVKPGDPLIKIVSIKNLDFQLEIPSNWLKWLKIGSKFYVHVNEINQNILAHVVRINPEINSISQTVRIIGKADDTPSNLLPGMSGQAKFIR